MQLMGQTSRQWAGLREALKASQFSGQIARTSPLVGLRMLWGVNAFSEGREAFRRGAAEFNAILRWPSHMLAQPAQA